MRIIFRYDDFSAAEQHSFEVDEALFDMFLDLKAPLLVAVTPRMSAAIRDPLNQRFFAIEEDAQRVMLLGRGLERGWQLALHGLTHQSTTDLSGTELRHVPQEIQEEKIVTGRRILTACFPGVPLNVFVPPWNSYDDITVQCLARHDFRLLCAGNIELPRREHQVMIVPSLMTPRDLLDYIHAFSVDDLVEDVGPGCLVITMHQYEFRRLGRNDYVELEHLAQGIRQLLTAGAQLGVFDLDATVENYMRHNHARLRSKIHLVQQMRIQRARGLWALATVLGRPLGHKGSRAAKSGAARLCWYLDLGEDQLRSWLQPIKAWVLQQRHKLSTSQ